MVYRIAFCDDNAADFAYVEAFVLQWAEETGNIVHVRFFSSAEAYLFHYAADKTDDILLLDIEMPGMSGVSLARQVRRDNDDIQIVFITGFPDFMAEGYEVSALHYLMKPVNGDALSAVLDKAVKNLGKTEASVLFFIDGESVRVLVKQIVSAEAFAHSVVVTTTEGTLALQMGISELEKRLRPDLVRCHRSYLVGIRFIKSISKAEVTLDTGATLPLSRSHYQAVNQAFIRYFRGSTT